MKSYIIFTVLLMVAVLSAAAQDSTKTLGSEGDPALRESSEDLRQMNLRDMVKISAADLPDAVKKTLERPNYKGPEKTFYKHKSKEEYGVEIRDGEITQFFQFDKNGKLVTNRR